LPRPEAGAAGDLTAPLERGLELLDRTALRRLRRRLDSAQGPTVELDGCRVANFSGNDYLGLAAHPRLKAAATSAIAHWGAGAGASHLVSGHMAPHEQAEHDFARFARLPEALLFSSGYAANLGVLTALADRGAEIFADRLNHASLNDGALLSRATFTRYPHLDLAALAARLARSTAKTRVIATDTVFSMDGDLAPLPQLLALAEAHDAWLLLDDAHGIGVLGERGRGALAHFGLHSPRIAYMATLGKALGGYGAFVAGAPVLIDWLVQKSRTYIFTTALPPAIAAAASAAIGLLEDDPAPVQDLQDNIAHFRGACAAEGITLLPSITAIQPLLVGKPAVALAASRALLEQGFLVPAIRPPTVPAGTSRLRISLCATHAREQLDRLAGALGTLGRDGALG
jgi:8-amino-7-oxononanoate synthase